MHKYLILNTDNTLGNQFAKYINKLEDCSIVGYERDYNTKPYDVKVGDISCYSIAEQLILDEQPNTIIYSPEEVTDSEGYIRETSGLLNILDALKGVSCRFVYCLPSTIYLLQGEVTETSALGGYSQLELSKYLAFKEISKKLSINYVSSVYPTLLWERTTILKNILDIVDSNSILYIPSLNFLDGNAYVHATLQLEQRGVQAEEYIISDNVRTTPEELTNLIYSCYKDLGIPIEKKTPIALNDYLLLNHKAMKSGVNIPQSNTKQILKDNIKGMLNERI